MNLRTKIFNFDPTQTRPIPFERARQGGHNGGAQPRWRGPRAKPRLDIWAPGESYPRRLPDPAGNREVNSVSFGPARTRPIPFGRARRGGHRSVVQACAAHLPAGISRETFLATHVLMYRLVWDFLMFMKILLFERARRGGCGGGAQEWWRGPRASW